MEYKLENAENEDFLLFHESMSCNTLRNKILKNIHIYSVEKMLLKENKKE